MFAFRREGAAAQPGPLEHSPLVEPVRRDGPRPDLYVLVGPSGAGKTTAVARAVERGEFAPWQVVSTDEIRRVLLGDQNNHTQNDRVAAAFRGILAAILRGGITAVADATHLTREHRVTTARVGLESGARVVYWVVDRPLDAKLRDAGWRREVLFRGGDDLVSRDHRRMVEATPDVLAGDGLPGVVIRDARTNARA